VISEWIVAASSAIGAAAAVAVVIVAWHQLSSLNRNIRVDGLIGLLQLEAEINDRKQTLVDVAHEITAHSRLPKKDQNSRLLRELEERLKDRTESYLNAVERLCFCIHRGYFPEKEWRAEYREWIATDIEDHEEFFGASTSYTHMVKLHEMWRDT